MTRPRSTLSSLLAISSVMAAIGCSGQAAVHDDGVLLTLSQIAVALIAAVHVYILVLEMFLWTTPRCQRTFGLTADFARASKALAANQGLYNGFLAAGLLWGLARGAAGRDVEVFFLACIVIAGVYGAATAARKILFVQAIPGAVALALVLAT